MQIQTTKFVREDGDDDEWKWEYGTTVEYSVQIGYNKLLKMGILCFNFLNLGGDFFFTTSIGSNNVFIRMDIELIRNRYI